MWRTFYFFLKRENKRGWEKPHNDTLVRVGWRRRSLSGLIWWCHRRNIQGHQHTHIHLGHVSMAAARWDYSEFSLHQSELSFSVNLWDGSGLQDWTIKMTVALKSLLGNIYYTVTTSCFISSCLKKSKPVDSVSCSFLHLANSWFLKRIFFALQIIYKHMRTHTNKCSRTHTNTQ